MIRSLIHALSLRAPQQEFGNTFWQGMFQRRMSWFREPVLGSTCQRLSLDSGGDFCADRSFRGVVRVNVFVEDLNELRHDAIALQRGE
jgi:hypothetical protein